MPELTPIDAEAAVERYRAIIRVPTVSKVDASQVRWEQYERFRALLPQLYPHLHAVLEQELHAGHSLLYRWPGREPGDPVVLMAHYDVVDPGELSLWSHPPFAADMIEGADGPVVVGRGAIDDKASLTALLEAVEAHVAAGTVPRRDVYLAFSHDEEIAGAATGTKAIVAALRERGIHPALVLDEGGIVGEPVLPGAPVEMALIGVSEKGAGAVRIVGRGEGGHASVPPEESVLSRLAKAITALEAPPHRTVLNEPTRRLIERIGAGARGPLGESVAALAAGDEEAAIAALQRVSPFAAAMTSSRAIATQVGGGHAVNAVPESAWAHVNARIVVGSSIAEVFDRVRSRVAPFGFTVEDVASYEPSPVSPSEGPMWQLLETSVKATYGDHVVVAPYVNNGGTDARSYTGIAENVYRFSPFAMTIPERDSLHAVDERLSVAAFVDGVRFYRVLIAGLTEERMDGDAGL